MKTLKIDMPEGFKIKTFDAEKGEVVFEPVQKDVKERIRTFDDVLKEKGLPQDYSELLSDLGYAPDEIAYVKLKLIVEVLNEGWEPDWTNKKEYKYYPWFNMSSPSGARFSYGDFDFWCTGSFVGSRLCFKSRELAEYAAKQFKDIYRDYLTLDN